MLRQNNNDTERDDKIHLLRKLYASIFTFLLNLLSNVELLLFRLREL